MPDDSKGLRTLSSVLRTWAEPACTPLPVFPRAAAAARVPATRGLAAVIVPLPDRYWQWELASYPHPATSDRLGCIGAEVVRDPYEGKPPLPRPIGFRLPEHPAAPAASVGLAQPDWLLEVEAL